MAARGGKSPHAPETGLLRRILGSFHVTGVFWYKFHRWGISLLPAWAIAVIIWPFTAFFFLVLLNIRRAIASNLVAVLGPCDWFARQVRIFKTMLQFAWCLTERYESLSTDREIHFEVHGQDAWRSMADERGGFITLTAHIGSWEAAAKLPSSRLDRTVHLFREQEADPEAQEFIRSLIEDRSRGTSFRVHFVGGEADASLGAMLLSALREGDIIALQGDRPRAGGDSVTVSLFGRPFPVPVGPAALARAAGTGILPVFVFREGRLKARIVFRDVIRVARTRDRAADIAETARSFATELEWAIRHRPHQWFCFRELWPGRRRGASPWPAAAGSAPSSR